MDNSTEKSITIEELKQYIPDVYQYDILDIDYTLLWNAGIRLLSFDIDDTINTMIKNKVFHSQPKNDIKELFDRLKDMGFKVVLLSNASEKNARRTFEQITADGFICEAKKPSQDGFERVYAEYGNGLEKTQWAHIGNSMRKDVLGGNLYGCITCLVRDMGRLTRLGLALEKSVGANKGSKIRKKLKEHNMWHKHHIEQKNDQYYQYGEKQKHSKA